VIAPLFEAARGMRCGMARKQGLDPGFGLDRLV